MNKPTQPATIEVERVEGDNEISFAVRGSSEWLQEMMPFALFNLGFITKRVWDSENEEQRAEILAGITALQRLETYQGEFVTVSIHQEQPQ